MPPTVLAWVNSIEPLSRRKTIQLSLGEQFPLIQRLVGATSSDPLTKVVLIVSRLQTDFDFCQLAQTNKTFVGYSCSPCRRGEPTKNERLS